jgi:hypothetical protein
LAKFNVCSGQRALSELIHVYFTSAAPLVVIVPLKFRVTGQALAGELLATVKAACMTFPGPPPGPVQFTLKLAWFDSDSFGVRIFTCIHPV